MCDVYGDCVLLPVLFIVVFLVLYFLFLSPLKDNNNVHSVYNCFFSVD